MMTRHLGRMAVLGGLCLAPLGLLVAAAARNPTAPPGDTPPAEASSALAVVAGVLMAAALVVAACNFFLSFIRRRPAQGPGAATRRIGDSLMTAALAPGKHVSVIPLVGTLLVLLAVVLGHGSRAFAMLGLLAMAIDTGGSAWVFVALCRNPSLLE